MALIDCPDCNHRVSDMAPTCPQCGRAVHDASRATQRVIARPEFSPGYWENLQEFHRKEVQERRRKTWIAGIATLVVGFVFFPMVSSLFESWGWGRNALGWLFVLGVVVWITCLVQLRQLRRNDEYYSHQRQLQQQFKDGTLAAC